MTTNNTNNKPSADKIAKDEEISPKEIRKDIIEQGLNKKPDKSGLSTRSIVWLCIAIVVAIGLILLRVYR